MTGAIVHIGYNKCGSTAIQLWLAENAARLARLGFAYRRTDPRPEVVCSNHQFLHLACSLSGVLTRWPGMAELYGFDEDDLRSQQDFTDRFSRDYDQWLESRPGATVVISNELLGHQLAARGLIEPFDAWLRARFDTVLYLAYVRRPVPWTVSAWKQECRTRPGEPPRGDIASRLPVTYFGQTLPIWLKSVGRERMMVRLFDEDWLADGGLIADFRRAIGVPARARLSRARRANVSRVVRGGVGRLGRAGPLGRLLRERTLPADPPLADEPGLQIARRNAEAMDWIGTAFFADRLPHYRAWLAGGPALSLKEA